MKTILTILICAVLCGCTQQKPDPRIQELVTQRAALESRIVQLEADNHQLREDVALNQKHLKQIGMSLSNAMPLVESIQLSMIHLMKLTNSAIPSVQKVSRAVNPGPTKEGIPAAIYKQIADEAAKDYPGDYTTQSYVIKNQIESYKKLHQ
jgi:outer membrane murein-binding lipoprotein Lpp